MQEIVCAVCGRRTALAPGTAMACPSCGAPISAPASASAAEDDSATRPSIFFPVPDVDETTKAAVPISVAEAAQDSDSANPANATAGDVTADYPMAPTPERTQTVPAPAMPTTEPQTQPALPVDAPAAWPGVPAAGADEPPAKQPSPRTRNPAAIISVLLLILLLLVVGAAGVLFANGRLPFFNATSTPAIATVTPAPTATAPAVLTSFTDGGQVFSVGYPTGWFLTAQNAPGTQPRLAIFANPITGASFDIGTLSTTDVPPQQIVEQELTLLGQKTGVANRSGPTSVFIAGESWTQESGDVTVEVNKQPTAMHATALAVIHGGHTVYMLELAPVDTYLTIEPFFQQILNSFEFLS